MPVIHLCFDEQKNNNSWRRFGYGREIAHKYVVNTNKVGITGRREQVAGNLVLKE